MAASRVIAEPVEWLEGHERHEYVVVDVFTSRPLEGNQLGVFLDGRPFSPDQMLRLAREMNFAETVTLERDEGRIVFGRMQQPIPTWEPFEREPELLSALGVRASGLPVELYRSGPGHVYVNLPGEQEVAELRPDMAGLAELGIAANCFAGRGTSWKTRMFLPAGGIPEDPATGSAAGPLAAHLARHGQIAFGEEIEIRQGEELNRPSLLYAKATGSPEQIESIEVGGGAQIVASGHFRIG